MAVVSFWLYGAEQGEEAGVRFCRFGMRLPKCLFANGKCALIKRKSFLTISLSLPRRGKIVECFCRVRVFRAEMLLPNAQGSLIERLGLRIPALLGVEEC